jgi:hypothetical protein
MTQAAKQCRLYVLNYWPETPISRFACRNTASGGISQHSAYGSPSSPQDSNALDIFAPGHGSDPTSQAYIQQIVDDLLAKQTKWSIRKILWKDGGAHENHAHVDFYPMIQDKMWCGKEWTPTWKFSDGSIIETRDPMPENGIYNGGDMECPWMPPCERHYNREEWGVDSKGVCNVPAQQEWAIDWNVARGAIVVRDEFRDDYERMLSDGRYWVMEARKG